MKTWRITDRLDLVIAWFDIWAGIYVDADKRRIYAMLPFIGFRWTWRPNA